MLSIPLIFCPRNSCYSCMQTLWERTQLFWHAQTLKCKGVYNQRGNANWWADILIFGPLGRQVWSTFSTIPRNPAASSPSCPQWPTPEDKLWLAFLSALGHMSNWSHVFLRMASQNKPSAYKPLNKDTLFARTLISILVILQDTWDNISKILNTGRGQLQLLSVFEFLIDLVEIA